MPSKTATACEYLAVGIAAICCQLSSGCPWFRPRAFLYLSIYLSIGRGVVHVHASVVANNEKLWEGEKSRGYNSCNYNGVLSATPSYKFMHRQAAVRGIYMLGSESIQGCCRSSLLHMYMFLRLLGRPSERPPPSTTTSCSRLTTTSSLTKAPGGKSGTPPP